MTTASSPIPAACTTRRPARRSSTSLRGVFGADKVKGDITINANAGPTPWLVNLRTAFEHLKTPGVQALFDGNSLKIGGLIGDSDRDGIISSLRSVLGTGLVFGTLTDKVGNLVTDVTTKTQAALSSLHTGFSTTDLLGILNQSIINFPTEQCGDPGSQQDPAAAGGGGLQAAAVEHGGRDRRLHRQHR